MPKGSGDNSIPAWGNFLIGIVIGISALFSYLQNIISQQEMNTNDIAKWMKKPKINLVTC